MRTLPCCEPVEVHVDGVLSSTSGEVIHGWALEGTASLQAEWDIQEDLAEGRLVECLAAYASIQPALR